MARNIIALISGMIFGLGLAVSHMVDPAKVLAFLDLAGNWDPSLAFVMGGAVAVSLLTFYVVLKQPHPLFAEKFHLPTLTEIDRRLVAGAAIFGVGWGLVGLCPGPAIASLTFMRTESLVFLISMIIGAVAANYLPHLLKMFGSDPLDTGAAS